MSVTSLGERVWRRPYGTPVSAVGPVNPTLKRGANNHCAYGAVASIPGLKCGAWETRRYVFG
ncbi:MAG: hypothetical protein ABSE51_17115 [Terracidiphilus sp.]|jgi:hypothetical protein